MKKRKPCIRFAVNHLDEEDSLEKFNITKLCHAEEKKGLELTASLAEVSDSKQLSLWPV